MEWFEKSSALNRYFAYNPLHCAMCLDWLKQHDKAYSFFRKAQALDPNSYYMDAMLGWHYVQVEDWATAKEWFVKSLSLMGSKNPIAQAYLEIVDKKLAAQPVGDPRAGRRRPDSGAPLRPALALLSSR